MYSSFASDLVAEALYFYHLKYRSRSPSIEQILLLIIWPAYPGAIKKLTNDQNTAF